MATVFDRLVALRDCLCDQIRESGSPAVGFCQVVPGEAAAADYFNCARDGGMAWVRLTSAYPSSVVGQVDVTVGNCAKELGFTVEIGMMRCAPGLLTQQGAPPKPAALQEAAALQLLDMRTMFRAVHCCPSISNKEYVAGQYQPLGPEGGIVGGILSVSMI